MEGWWGAIAIWAMPKQIAQLFQWWDGIDRGVTTALKMGGQNIHNICTYRVHKIETIVSFSPHFCCWYFGSWIFAIENESDKTIVMECWRHSTPAVHPLLRCTLRQRWKKLERKTIQPMCKDKVTCKQN